MQVQKLHTGLQYSSSHEPTDRTSCGEPGTGPASGDRSRAASCHCTSRSSASLRERIRSGRMPGRHAPALDPGTGGRAGGLARGRHRGLRPAGRGGLSGDAPGSAGARRQSRAHSQSASAGALAAGELRLPLSSRPARPGGVSTRDVAALGARRAARLAAGRPSAMAIRAERRSCAKRSLTTSGACAGRPPTPSTCSCAPGSCRGSRCVCRTLRSRGVRHVALEDPGWHMHRLIVESAAMRGRAGRGRR